MARSDPPIERVRKLALKLPGVEEGTTFGYPAFKVGGKFFAWFPKKKEVEEGSLGVRMSFVDRDLRLAAKPAARSCSVSRASSPAGCVFAVESIAVVLRR